MYQNLNICSKSIYDHLNFLDKFIKHRSSIEPNKNFLHESAINLPKISIEGQTKSSTANNLHIHIAVVYLLRL